MSHRWTPRRQDEARLDVETVGADQAPCRSSCPEVSRSGTPSGVFLSCWGLHQVLRGAIPFSILIRLSLTLSPALAGSHDAAALGANRLWKTLRFLSVSATSEGRHSAVPAWRPHPGPQDGWLATNGHHQKSCRESNRQDAGARRNQCSHIMVDRNNPASLPPGWVPYPYRAVVGARCQQTMLADLYGTHGRD